jgi:hypothetical protein
MHGLRRHERMLVKEGVMTATLRERNVETVHDQVVSMVAQRWAKAFVCKATIRTGRDQHPCGNPMQPCDIVGWYVSSGGNTIEWMAEVETEESLGDAQIAEKWNKAISRGIPFYLLVPRGMKELAFRLSQEQSVEFSYIYEFTFINGVCHIL